MSDRKNINRGYQKLTVWQDAADLYVLTSKIFRKLPYELRRVAANQIASVDSVHRNIAEGYCRRSLNEYLQFLNVGPSLSWGIRLGCSRVSSRGPDFRRRVRGLGHPCL